MKKSAAVIGAGISGMQAALSLADRGVKVYLIEKTSSIGGIMARLDKTMPTLDCSICILSPFMLAVARNPLIEIMTLSEVKAAERTNDTYILDVIKHPRYVDLDKCTGCRDCLAKCPGKVTLPFEEKFGKAKAIHFDFDQAIPAVPYIDKDACLHFTRGICGNCAKFCQKGAINFEQEEETVKLEVGGVFLATGAQPYLPYDRPEYGYGQYGNVITAMEIERLLSASGPTGGNVVRTNDKKAPKNIAFINCVGSRDLKTGRGYCSKVCCMYGIKEALLVKDHDPEAKVTIFYIDIRASGKGYEEFFQRARGSIRFVRGRPGEIIEVGNGDLLLRYEDTELQESREEVFDMVVLNSALVPCDDAQELSDIFEIPLNEYGFFQPGGDISSPISTDNEKVFIVGACQGPNDITDSVSQSIGAVSKSYSIAGDTQLRESDELPGADVDHPRIGVFVCHCGQNIGKYVDVNRVVEYAKTLSDVVYAEGSLFTCSETGQKAIKEKIRELDLNRVVVAACSPKTHENTFQEALVEAGLNPYMLEMANIRNQCSWVHSDCKEEATRKSEDLVRMAVSKARILNPLYEREVDVNQSTVVIGGGFTGMASALEVSRNGFDVYLVEREGGLGGKSFVTDPEFRDIARTLEEKVRSDDRIKVFLSSEIKHVSGFVGDFEITIDTPQGERKLNPGTVIIATGYDFSDPSEDGTILDDSVITEAQLVEMMDRDEISKKRYAFLLCSGVRNKEHPECSRVCCLSALRQIRRLQDMRPDADISVLYQDIRAYGFYEDLYREVSDRGARFIRYSGDRRPEIDNDNKSVKVYDVTSSREIIVDFDYCIMERGAVPARGTNDLRKLFKASAAPTGFYAEAHLKLAPLDTALDGVYIAGACQYPKTVEESLSQAVSAAGRASIVMGSGKYKVQPTTASIDAAKCVACGLCEKLCPYKALTMSADGKHMEVIEVSCKGCGTCSAFCPSNAISMAGFTYRQEKEKIKALLKGVKE